MTDEKRKTWTRIAQVAATTLATIGTFAAVRSESGPLTALFLIILAYAGALTLWLAARSDRGTERVHDALDRLEGDVIRARRRLDELKVEIAEGTERRLDAEKMIARDVLEEGEKRLAFETLSNRAYSELRTDLATKILAINQRLTDLEEDARVRRRDDGDRNAEIHRIAETFESLDAIVSRLGDRVRNAETDLGVTKTYQKELADRFAKFENVLTDKINPAAEAVTLIAKRERARTPKTQTKELAALREELGDRLAILRDELGEFDEMVRQRVYHVEVLLGIRGPSENYVPPAYEAADEGLIGIVRNLREDVRSLAGAISGRGIVGEIEARAEFEKKQADRLRALKTEIGEKIGDLSEAIEHLAAFAGRVERETGEKFVALEGRVFGPALEKAREEKRP